MTHTRYTHAAPWQQPRESLLFRIQKLSWIESHVTSSTGLPNLRDLAHCTSCVRIPIKIQIGSTSSSHQNLNLMAHDLGQPCASCAKLNQHELHAGAATRFREHQRHRGDGLGRLGGLGRACVGAGLHGRMRRPALGVPDGATQQPSWHNNLGDLGGDRSEGTYLLNTYFSACAANIIWIKPNIEPVSSSQCRFLRTSSPKSRRQGQCNRCIART